MTLQPRASASRTRRVRGGLGMTSATIMPGRRRRDVEREAGVDVGVEADRRGVDHDVGALGHARSRPPRARLGGAPAAVSRDLAVQQLDQRAAPGLVAVDDR